MINDWLSRLKSLVINYQSLMTMTNSPATSIVCLGLSHHTAPVALREQLSCSLTDLDDFLHTFREEVDLAEHGRFPGIHELVILSTCNRIELYAYGDADQPDPRQLLTAYLSDLRGVDTAVFADHLYYHTGQNAVDHLMRVAAGLDSLVLGEPQILGQVNTAYTTAAQAQAAGPVLRRLFEAAIRAGKRPYENGHQQQSGQHQLGGHCPGPDRGRITG